MATLLAVVMAIVGLRMAPSLDHTLVVPRRAPLSDTWPGNAAGGLVPARGEAVASLPLRANGEDGAPTGEPVRAPVAMDTSVRGASAPLGGVLPLEGAIARAAHILNATVDRGAAVPLRRLPRSEPAWLCLNGHQAPTTFILGCQKCGTTSLIAQMEKALSWRNVRVQTGRSYVGAFLLRQGEALLLDGEPVRQGAHVLPEPFPRLLQGPRRRVRRDAQLPEHAKIGSAAF